MKYIKYNQVWVAILFMIIACGEPIDKKLILGEWKGAEWVVKGQPGMIDASTAAFTFHEDGTYRYAYGDAVETGDYFISNQELFTTPKGGIKMMVKIIKLTPDSLVFDMNRGGTSEQLTLTRQ